MTAIVGATTARRTGWALLATSVVATTGVLLTTDAEPMVRVALLALGFGALATVAGASTLRRELTMGAVLVATLVLMTVSVALPSQQSNDLWSYAMQGRIAAHYGASPYVQPPSHYPRDPLLPLVGSGWRGTRSVYGPVFTGASAAIMAVTGTARLPIRLAFQLLAALAVLAAMALLARRTRDPVALLLIGVNPVIALEVVNTGRNDALVGLAVLGGVLLVGRRHVVAGAAVLAVAALVKIAALAALAGVLLWALRSYGLKVVLQAGGLAAALIVGAYALAGGTPALRPLADASDRLSRASIWQLARADGIQHLFGADPAEPIRHVITVIGPVALLTAVGLALFFAVSRLTDLAPELVAASAVVAFLLTGSYVLPSYAAWVLPVLAWRHRAGLSRLVLVWSALLVAAYQAGRGLPIDADDVLPYLMALVTVVFGTAALVVLMIAAARRLRGVGTGASGGGHAHGVRPASPASRSAIGASSETLTEGPNSPVARMSSVSIPWAI